MKHTLGVYDKEKKRCSLSNKLNVQTNKMQNIRMSIYIFLYNDIPPICRSHFFISRDKSSSQSSYISTSNIKWM